MENRKIYSHPKIDSKTEVYQCSQIFEIYNAKYFIRQESIKQETKWINCAPRTDYNKLHTQSRDVSKSA